VRLVAALSTFLFALASTAQAGGTEPGQAYCFGVSCPCGNDDGTAGCVNSTGVGASMTATGSTSVSADDLAFHVTNAATTANGTFYMGTEAAVMSVGDGLRCAGGQTFRFPGHQNSGHAGTYTYDHLVGQTPHLIAPGTTWYFQAFYRDVPVGQSPCGNFPHGNLSNGYSVTFTP